MVVNFNQPYFATNPQDFWRRWHISLSGWLRDYLYVPLGGGRKGLVSSCINVFITMVLGFLLMASPTLAGLTHEGQIVLVMSLMATVPWAVVAP